MVVCPCGEWGGRVGRADSGAWLGKTLHAMYLQLVLPPEFRADLLVLGSQLLEDSIKEVCKQT